MRRALLLPVLLLATACSTRPWTPAVSVAYWSEETPGAREIYIPTTKEALRRWQLSSDDPWSPWAKWTLFAALDAYPEHAWLPEVEKLEVVQEARAAARAIAAKLPSDTAIVLDLRGAASVAFGAELARGAHRSVSLVPTFNNWPDEEELIPAEETLAAIVAEQPYAQGAAAGVPVFMLDAWRLAYRFDTPDDGVFDNRYILHASDLPTAAVLHAHGITRLLYVVESLEDTEVEEDDLHHAFAALESGGVQLAMVDLPWLQSNGDASRAFPDMRLHITRRAVLVDDPAFYARAHGGFGGTHGVPTGIHGVHIWGPATS